LQVRAAWDANALCHCEHIIANHPGKSVVFGGDLNILPKESDVDKGAFSNLKRTLRHAGKV